MFILAAPSAPSIKSWSMRSALNFSFQSLCHVHYCYTRLCYTVKGFETPIFILKKNSSILLWGGKKAPG